MTVGLSYQDLKRWRIIVVNVAWRKVFFIKKVKPHGREKGQPDNNC